jgi:hypothetical protein
MFTFFVLTDLHSTDDGGPSLFEYITWGWTVTMVMEEIRQVRKFGIGSILSHTKLNCLVYCTTKNEISVIHIK